MPSEATSHLPSGLFRQFPEEVLRSSRTSSVRGQVFRPG
ncbi:MAG: hypothetical protein AVDCRST_MAG01-01-1660 [uncultured Rubrobacteraceae bacterium]|uniref:Uncharacterized protein n=1 Tax=uncultured Rubrobacteraceae bacterium TaxID=349277 RepID=A0A6J4PC30_9ACTN|nr:MAG: hypothetical protein AVDCRST_MAG01-01-1660 [uncultured Rubrobacteraceae bacterium]